LLQPLISSNCHTASLKISVEIENNKIKWRDELWVYNATFNNIFQFHHGRQFYRGRQF
jgi:hypothetical protein